MKKGLYIMNRETFNDVYPEEIRNEIEKDVDIPFRPMSAAEVLTDPSILKEAQFIFTGWGALKMDREFLEAAPALEAVFFGAGSVKHIVTPEFWNKGIKLTSAYAANALPVAEFTIAQILFSLKRGWYHMNKIRDEKSYCQREAVSGAYKSTVGIVSLGMIGRRVAEMLKSFDLEVIAYDPYVSDELAKELGIKPVTLEELFKESHVVSLHTPWLKETEGLIDNKLFELMKKGSTFINTARGAVVNERDMIRVLTERSDITALLDVTHPEPPVEGSPLYNMANVYLTPHLAGSQNRECARMGAYMVEELHRYINHEKFKWNITEEKAGALA